MKYYPLSRIVTGSVTSGDEFLIKGVPYVGPYYRTYDNKYFSGNDPVTGDNDELIFRNNPELGSDDKVLGYNPLSSLVTNKNSDDYNNIKGINIQETVSYVGIPSYFPQPTDIDYKRGFIMRYFVKKRNQNGYLIEVEKDIFESLKEVNSQYGYETYHSIDTFWQLTGPLHDFVDTKTGIRTSGIIDTNKRLIESKDKVFRGLLEFIGGKYSKFSKPTQ
jgi:hypothetical protein